ncbi:MAG: hypothetical protein Q8O89_05860, partial [Nanoarchaeota archaeon]|nr:hypothetical protein [Nanoarchaeota archaeon]
MKKNNFRIGITLKLAVLMVCVSLIPLAFLGVIIVKNTYQNVESEQKITMNYVLESQEEYFTSFIHNKKNNLNFIVESLAVGDLLDSSVKNDAEGVKTRIRLLSQKAAEQAGEYIRTHPNMTVKDLQNDSVFQKIAVQPVGRTGYTALTDVSTLINRFHKNPKIVGTDLSLLSKSLPAFWGVMSKSRYGQEAEGFYDWKEADGSIRQKYMHIQPIDAVTADNVTMNVAATTYVDEYSSSLAVLFEADSYLTQIAAAFHLQKLFLVDANGVLFWGNEKNL